MVPIIDEGTILPPRESDRAKREALHKSESEELTMTNAAEKIPETAILTKPVTCVCGHLIFDGEVIRSRCVRPSDMKAKCRCKQWVSLLER